MRSRAHYRDDHAPLLRAGAVFPEKNALPGAQQQAAGADRDSEPGAGKNAARMGGHIVRSFEIVAVGRVTVGRQARKDGFQVAPYVGVGVFRDRQRTTGVLHEDMCQAGFHAGGGNGLRHRSGDVAGAAPLRGEIEDGLVGHRIGVFFQGSHYAAHDFLQFMRLPEKSRNPFHARRSYLSDYR